MKVKLIPVIEILNHDEDIQSPDAGPFWDYADEWENYYYLCNLKAGYSDQLKPYLKGSSLYDINNISDEDLLTAIQKMIAIQQKDEDETLYPFSGGYVLRIDNQDKYFPQCCGDLSDIVEWENILKGETAYFYPGHPFPKVNIQGKTIHFDFVNIEIHENFAPPVPDDFIEIEMQAFEIAMHKVKEELLHFSGRLTKLNKTNNMGIVNIDKYLVYG